MEVRGSSTHSAGLDVRIMEDRGSSTNSAGLDVRIMEDRGSYYYQSGGLGVRITRKDHDKG